MYILGVGLLVLHVSLKSQDLLVCFPCRDHTQGCSVMHFWKVKVSCCILPITWELKCNVEVVCNSVTSQLHCLALHTTLQQ